jgi:hypothetical protein
VSFLSLLGLSFPAYFPFLSLGRLYQRNPRTFTVSLLCVGSTQRRATALAVEQVFPPNTGGGEPLPNGHFWALGCPLAESIPRRGHITTSRLSIPALNPPCGKCIIPHATVCPRCVYCVSIPSRGMCGCHLVWWVVGSGV